MTDEQLLKDLEEAHSTTLLTPKKMMAIDEIRNEFEEKRVKLVKQYLLKEIAILKQHD